MMEPTRLRSRTTPSWSLIDHLKLMSILNAVDYVVRIYNHEGKMIEEVADTDFGQDYPEIYKAMSEMYDTARRIAMGVEEALDEILGELKDEDDLPF